MKQDLRTIVDTSQDSAFGKPTSTVKRIKPSVVKQTNKLYLTSQDSVFGKPTSTGSRIIKQMDKLYLARKNAYLPIYVMSNPTAKTTVILLPGKDADLDKIIEGNPSSIDFLSRTRDYFFNENFNVIVAYRASDISSIDFDYNYRETTHVTEIERVIDFANKKFKKPIWLISTSKGTISAVSTAIAVGNKKVKGLVLTSTITSQTIESTPISSLAIDTLKMPILMIHHTNDACPTTVPNDASTLINNFTSSTIKKFILITGGSDPIGHPCLPLHWHGYHNYEKETVKIISNWIKKPIL